MKISSNRNSFYSLALQASHLNEIKDQSLTLNRFHSEFKSLFNEIAEEKVETTNTTTTKAFSIINLHVSYYYLQDKKHIFQFKLLKLKQMSLNKNLHRRPTCN